MSKKMCKRIFSVILSLGLVMVQSMNVNAAGNEIGDRKDLIRRVIGGADKLLFDLLFDAHRTPPLVNDKTFDTIPVLAMSIQREHRESRHVECASGLRRILHLCTSATKNDIFWHL